ncbi:AraC family transcriptional regulator [Arundinibacter roseus]|uniref:AraC family transcriptional regulator n=1 Tax=Arundinibacter roseus TaxID=2070510 RepID=A0A4R4KLK9_9BACT|nr:AraC family transcriptional regulator [Arundinibacter roseus]TDB67491.1 AraC family transcriptional regulator [Arundinibacter roseus]
MVVPGKSRGFTGEKIIEVPAAMVEKCLSMPLISALLITRMGFYPKAQHHYYHRPAGISQVIFLYCTDGQGWVDLPTHRLIMQAGDFLAIPPFLAHSYGADPQNPWTIYWFHYIGNGSPQLLDAFRDRTGNYLHTGRVVYSTERVKLFDQIFETFLKGYSTANLLYANLTLSYFLASFLVPENFEPPSPISDTHNPVYQAIDRMQNSLSEPLTVEEFARSVHLSVSFFSRKFKLATGYAPIEYFNHLRVQKACQLLHFSDLRVNEVAAEIGIHDPFYFSRLFKKHMGFSPVEYRKIEGRYRRKQPPES